MVDVDPQVVSADELVRRVEALLAAERAAEPTLPADLPDAHALHASLHSLALHIAELQDRFAVQPVPIAEPPTLIARMKQLSKRTLRKSVRWYIEPRLNAQVSFDLDSARFATTQLLAFQAMQQELDDLRTSTQRALDVLQWTTERLLATAQGARAVTATVHAVEAKVATLSGSQQAREEQAIDQREQLRIILERLGAASATGAEIDYVAFEERFRGSSDELAKTQQEYLRYLPPADDQGIVVDVGCGRGEMVEVLADAGHEAVGIDLDAGMVAVAAGKGLTVEEAGALGWLEGRPDGTLKGVFSAQVVEHLFTSELQRFIALAHQKLRRDGVLIIETINPRSLHTLSNHFFADTSHIRPVHPETLRFLCQAAGFSKVDLVLRSRHPMADVPADVPAGPLRDAVAALLETVYGDQDYAIVATK